MKKPFTAFSCTVKTASGVERTVVITAQQVTNFYRIWECERCGTILYSRALSFFNYQVICLTCRDKESAAKVRLKELGKDPVMYEGSGSIPKEVASIVAVRKIKGGVQTK